MYNDVPEDFMVSPNNPKLRIPVQIKSKKMATSTSLSVVNFDKEYEFDDELTFEHGYNYSSSPSFMFGGKNVAKTYNMFWKDFIRMMKDCDFKGGVIKGRWRFKKQGSSLGVYKV